MSKHETKIKHDEYCALMEAASFETMGNKCTCGATDKNDTMNKHEVPTDEELYKCLYEDFKESSENMRKAYFAGARRAEQAVLTKLTEQADPNAPWLTEAHMLCTDLGIEQGNITSRIKAVRESLTAGAELPFELDAITVNLMRLADLDKHKARECAAIVLQMLAIRNYDDNTELPPLPESDEPGDRLWDDMSMQSYASRAIAADRARQGQEAVAFLHNVTFPSGAKGTVLSNSSEHPYAGDERPEYSDSKVVTIELVPRSYTHPAPAQAEKVEPDMEVRDGQIVVSRVPRGFTGSLYTHPAPALLDAAEQALNTREDVAFDALRAALLAHYSDKGKHE